MLTIENIQLIIPGHTAANYAHPFYKDSIKALFGVDIPVVKEYVSTRNRDTITDILRKTIGNTPLAGISYFFDIRLQEELGSPSPQYEILFDLKLNKTTPICIHGEDIMILNEGLSMANSLLTIGGQAIFSVSSMNSAGWQSQSSEFALSFLAVCNNKSDNTIMLKGLINDEK